MSLFTKTFIIYLFSIYWFICAVIEAYAVGKELKDWSWNRKIVPILFFMVISFITAPLNLISEKNRNL